MLDFIGIKTFYQLNTEIINSLIFLHISCKVFITYYHYINIFQKYVTKKCFINSTKFVIIYQNF